MYGHIIPYKEKDKHSRIDLTYIAAALKIIRSMIASALKESDILLLTTYAGQRRRYKRFSKPKCWHKVVVDLAYCARVFCNTDNTRP